MIQKENTNGLFQHLGLEQIASFSADFTPRLFKRLIAITDQSHSSQAAVNQLRLAVASHSDLKIEEISLQDGLISEIEEKLNRDQSRETAYIVLDARKDGADIYRSPDAVIEELAEHAERPVFGLSSADIDVGALAVSIAVTDDHIGRAVDMLKRIGAGEKIDDISEPVFRQAATLKVNDSLIGNFQVSLAPKSNRPAQTIPPLGTVSFDYLDRQTIGIGVIFVLTTIGIYLLIVRFTNAGLKKSLEEANAKLKHETLYDGLSGLPNRRFVVESFEKDLSPAVSTALFHVDLDRFKHINDTFGHATGDFVLKTVSERLTNLTPRNGLVARLGGDEFLVKAEFRKKEHIAALGNSIVEELAKPVSFENHLCRFGASVGIAVCNERGDGELTIFQRADIALNRAKEAGRGKAVQFNARLGAQFREEKTLADEIAWGLDSGQFVPFFQPQLSSHTGEVVGVEALARWQHPKRGTLAPDAFLRVAERMGLVSEIDRAILLASQDILADWREHGIHIPKLSVNTSGKRLAGDTLIGSLQALDLGDTELCFELVESIFLDDEKGPLTERLEAVRSNGVRLEIDDFGTGHASIISLLRLRPDGFKIARQLVDPIEQDSGMLQLVRSIIDMGKLLDMEVTADGVETEAQAHILADMGCDVLQGYGLCHPASADVIADFILKQREKSLVAA